MSEALFLHEVAALGTKHGKERVIRPVLESALGLCVDLVPDFDTDRFGTFTREIPRKGTAIETARAKATAAIHAHGNAQFGISSEGSFGPHPWVPFVARGVELVLLIERGGALELRGVDITMETNFGSASVSSLEQALSFAERVSFPSHGIIVMASRDGSPDPTGNVIKGITDPAELADVVRSTLRSQGEAWLESDMRANFNPTRMESIARAAQALVRAAQSLCPSCAHPGYVAVERILGLPCADCGAPTTQVRAEAFRCARCERSEERGVSGPTHAEPFTCPFCNP